MSKLKQLSHFFVTSGSCTYCGSFWKVRYGYCHICLNKLLRKTNPRIRTVLTPNKIPITVRSLFDWNPQESDLLSCLVTNLKGMKNKSRWCFWAGQFALFHSVFGQSYFLVPCWSSTAAKEDHAVHFAGGLQSHLHSEIKNILYKKPSSDVKTKRMSRLERKTKSKNHEIFSKESGDFALKSTKQSFIFIDDVVTTGSTAEIAFKALGHPKTFEVWCLCYRTPLRKPTNFDTLHPIGDL